MRPAVGDMSIIDQPLGSPVYDVAISFAECDGAAAALASELNARLSRRGLRVYYFRSTEAAAATLGEKLEETLRSVFADRSRVVVAIGSEHYGATHYTALEYNATRSRPRDTDGRARLVPLSADGHVVPGLAADTHHLDARSAVAHLCQRCGRSSESSVRRRAALALIGLSASFMAAFWATGCRTASIVAAAITVAAVAGGPAWAGAFLAVPNAWMWARRRKARCELAVLTEGPRLGLYRRAGGVAGWAFLAVWCVAAAAFLVDLALYRAINADLHGRRLDGAVEFWGRWNPSLLYHRHAAQDAINAAIASSVREAPTFELALARMEEWRRNPVVLDRAFEASRKDLARRGAPVLTRTIYAPPEAPPAYWWKSAWGIEVWPAEAAEWHTLVHGLGARQLFLALADEGSDPFSWSAGRLRDFEVTALESYAGEVVRRHDPTSWGSSRHRIALIALTRDWPALGKAASAAVSAEDPPAEPREAIAFVTNAPSELVRPWLMANLTPSTKGYVLKAIGEAVERRGDPQSVFALLDLSNSERLPYDPFSQYGSLIVPESPQSSALAMARIRTWMSAGPAPRPSVLRCLLASIIAGDELDGLQRDEREALLGKITGLLDHAYAAVEPDDPAKAYREVAPAAYEVIARLGLSAGAEYLLKELEEAAAHRFGGPGGRDALLRALRSIHVDGRAGHSLRLAKATREDAVRFEYDDSLVQAEYLITLAASPENAEGHREFVASLLSHYASESAKPRLERSHFLVSVRQGFAALFGRLGERELISLFRRPDVIELQGGLWESFFLSILKDAGRRIPEPIETEVLQELERQPRREQHGDDAALIRDLMDSLGHPSPWDDVPDYLAFCGGTKSVTFFRGQYAAGREEVLPLLARLGDVETVAAAVRQVRGDTTPQSVEMVTRAVESLRQPDRTRVVGLCLANRAIPASSIFRASDGLPPADCREAVLKCFERGGTPSTLLLERAVLFECRDERLVGLARDQFTGADNLRMASSALAYLQRAAPATCSDLLSDRQAVERVAGLLRAATDVEWARFVEESRFPDNDPKARSGLATLAVARAGLIALKPDQVPEEEWVQQDFFAANGMIVKNPLLAGLCRGGRAEDGRTAVLAATDGDALPVVFGGNLAMPETTHRAYALWLAAYSFRGDSPSAVELIETLRLLDALFSGNGALARGAASVCLAAGPG